MHRGRPSADLVHVITQPDPYSFPSGHVTQYTLFFGFCFYLAFTVMKPGLLRTLLLVFLGGMVLLVVHPRLHGPALGQRRAGWLYSRVWPAAVGDLGL